MSKEERQKKAEQNSPHFIVKLKDTELLEDTTVCFMIIARGDPAPKLKLYMQLFTSINRESVLGKMIYFYFHFYSQFQKRRTA